EKSAVESLAQVATSDTGSGGPTPGPRPGAPGSPGVGPPDTNSSPSAPVDQSRVESARRTVLYRAPARVPAGTLAPSAQLRVPEAKRPQLESLAPLATIQVTARVRTGRTRFLGNPVLDLISLETLP